jgi:hypothetical protein
LFFILAFLKTLSRPGIIKDREFVLNTQLISDLPTRCLNEMIEITLLTVKGIMGQKYGFFFKETIRIVHGYIL